MEHCPRTWVVDHPLTHGAAALRLFTLFINVSSDTLMNLWELKDAVRRRNNLSKSFNPGAALINSRLQPHGIVISDGPFFHSTKSWERLDCPDVDLITYGSHSRSTLNRCLLSAVCCPRKPVPHLGPRSVADSCLPSLHYR